MFETALDAETAFYAAFGAGDLETLMRIWDRENPVCIHPNGPRLESLESIRESWRMILEQDMPRSFSLRGRIITGDAEHQVHMLEERITVPGTNFVAPPVLATNVYRRRQQSWLMVLHHASVAPASLPAVRPPPATPTRSGTLH